MQKIVPCLWFNNNATEAAAYYAGTFKNTEVGGKSCYDADVAKHIGQKPGAVMIQQFEIEGLKILGLNGGDHYKLNASTSLVVTACTESEIQNIWRKLNDGGEVRMELAAIRGLTSMVGPLTVLESNGS